jgi:hypothetical protein
MVLDSPMSGDWFAADVAQVLMPELRSGEVASSTTGRALAGPQ